MPSSLEAPTLDMLGDMRKQFQALIFTDSGIPKAITVCAQGLTRGN